MKRAMIEYSDLEIGIPERLVSFYFPESGDAACVTYNVFGETSTELVFLDDEGDIQAFSKGDQGGELGTHARPLLTYGSEEPSPG
ncbi:hypothetical protein [Kitasatospora sp. NPDC005751]|uniref:hypothetical protein n=1 Tax=unclassified Kitasatospora TaxID=2633591 RepID=UPI0033C7E04D